MASPNESKNSGDSKKQDSKSSSCEKNCLECFRVCNETLRSCLEKGGEHSNAEHINMLIDCARICQTSADFLSRGSDFHRVTCEACKKICEKCAEDCRKMNDKEMIYCAEVCEKCVESCEKMLAH